MEIEEKLIPFSSMKEYGDVQPIVQDDGPNGVVVIKYDPLYIDCMNYFRALFRIEEISKRALNVTTRAITLNAGNYTAWYYRRKILIGLNYELDAEMEFTNNMIRKSEKNYQVWYHRQRIMERYFEDLSEKIKCEKEFLQEMLDSDEKNYHCWSYREWFVKTFNLFDGEFLFVESMIDRDVRNNSAWNYRFFLVHHTRKLGENVRKSEIEYAFEIIKRAKSNESPWNYLNGMMSYKECQNRINVVKLVEKKTRDLYNSTKMKFNEHLLYTLLRCNEFFNNVDKRKEESIEICKLLMKNDGIRENYWKYRLQKIIDNQTVF